MLTLSLAAERRQHRVEAIAHVKVGLSLRTVAENVKRCGGRGSARSRTHDRGCSVPRGSRRSGTSTAEAEALAIGLDQSFAREFGRAVERGLNGKRRVFGRRDDAASP